jgi:hypothetical protein
MISQSPAAAFKFHNAWDIAQPAPRARLAACAHSKPRPRNLDPAYISDGAEDWELKLRSSSIQSSQDVSFKTNVGKQEKSIC